MKKYFFALFLLFALSIPLFTYAAITGIPFGGYVTATIPCTCSAGSVVVYTPFFNGSKLPSAGSLWLVPGSLLYKYFVPGLPTSWNLGTYTPGASGCFVLAPVPGEPCLPVPAMGMIQFMGTSPVGAAPYKPI